MGTENVYAPLYIRNIPGGESVQPGLEAGRRITARFEARLIVSGSVCTQAEKPDRSYSDGPRYVSLWPKSDTWRPR